MQYFYIIIFETHKGQETRCVYEVKFHLFDSYFHCFLQITNTFLSLLIWFPTRKEFLSFFVCSCSEFLTIAFRVRMMLFTSRDRTSLSLQWLKVDNALPAAFPIGSPRTNPAYAVYCCKCSNNSA